MAAIGSTPVWAQARPDAGRLLDERSAPPTLPRREREEAPITQPLRPSMRAPDGVRFQVTRIRLSGNTVYGDDVLAPLLQPVLGSEATLAELEAVAERVMGFYRERGYFVARAYVPAQDVKDGEVEIQVREGRLGGVELRRSATSRIDPKRLEAVVSAALGPLESEPLLRQEELERAMLLMNDLPGIEAQATLVPGTRSATTQLLVDVKEGPRLSGNVGYDNHGNRYTGEHRPTATLQFDNPGGLGDQLKLGYSGLQDAPYFNAGYSLPVGGSGLRLVANLVATRYRLCCEFASSDVTGHARVSGLQASYPLLRARQRNMSLMLSVERRRFVDAAAGVTTSDKTSHIATLGAAYDARDDWAGGGLSFLNLGLSAGRLRQQVAPLRSDSQRKLNLFAGRLQTLPAGLVLYAGLTAQHAAAALDSSEKMALGGPNGVRAYPASEAPGDSANLFNLELRRPLAERLQGYVFVDWGEARNHPDGAATGVRARDRLAAAGIGLSFDARNGLAARATLAAPIGNNPARATNNGHDSDGRRQSLRLWVQVRKSF